MRIGLILIIGIWLMISCQEIKECDLDTSTDYAIAGFYQFIDDEKEYDTILFDQITEKYSDLYYITSRADTTDDDTLSLVPLYLDPSDTVVTYVFETRDVDYELTMVYTKHLRIYYDDCDPVYSYKLDTAYSDEFDSVAIYSRLVDKQVSVNVELYIWD